MKMHRAVDSSQEDVMDYLPGKPEGITFMLPNTRANASGRCLLPWGYAYYLVDEVTFRGGGVYLRAFR